MTAQVFYSNFLGQLARDGLTPEQAAQHVWKPYALDALNITGTGRDTTLTALRVNAEEVAADMAAARGQAAAINLDFYRAQRAVIVLVPGFTHETLHNYSFHEEIQRRNSPHHIVMLKPGSDGGPSVEKVFSEGSGLKIAYARYPRSNAASKHIVGALFDLLHNSVTMRRWVVDEGRSVFLLGYSYGAPLILEMLAGLKAGRYADKFLLGAVRGMLSLSGDVGGSYLADDVLRPEAQLVNIHKVIVFCQRHRWAAKLAGLGTEQLMADMEGGVRSLGHEERQAAIGRYAPELPGNIKYFSLSAVMPLADYRRRWWQFNLDDYTMYRQALVSDPISIYNDGQVVLEDNLTPTAPQIAEGNRIHLGAVRTHHWGVSYKTFNFGWNRFPRRAFYRALMQTIGESLAAPAA